MSSETVVLYHGGCRDGFCSAWVINKYLKQLDEESTIKIDTKFIPAFYGQDPPDVTGKDVIIIDFCYPLEIMKDLCSKANGVTWLDHHKTAQPFVDYIKSIGKGTDEVCDWIFNNDKSGAGIAWDFFFSNEPRPWLVDYVEDRDLWAKKLPNTDSVNAYIAALEFNFEVWDDASELELEDVAEYGQIAVMKTEQYVKEVCKNVYYVDIQGTNDRDKNGYVVDYSTRRLFPQIPVVNICQVDCSEVLHKLCETHTAPFSLYWFKRQDGLYQYGLRSIGDFDVSNVAKVFGGGGHRNAAGFQLPYLLEELK